MSFFANPNTKTFFAIVGVLLVGGAAVAFGEYRRQQALSYLAETNHELAATKTELEGQVAELEKNLASSRDQMVSLLQILGTVQINNATFQEQIGHIGDTIGTLDTLSKLDPQLLQKYSKVFFLNEHYEPKTLATIDPQFVYDKGRVLQVQADMWPHLQKMLVAANANGLHLRVGSAYRSFGTQASLKANYKVTFGAGTANSFSADQGYSEHQLGTAVDLTTDEQNGALEGFEKTPESAWLLAHAYEYGFILSYPAGNKYYIYEPWHWRFVGVDLANKLHRENLNFYDMEQRVIDSYLAVIFN